LVKADARGCIIQFLEKPNGVDLKAMVSPKTSQRSTTKIGYWSLSERKKQKKKKILNFNNLPSFFLE